MMYYLIPSDANCFFLRLKRGVGGEQGAAALRAAEHSAEHEVGRAVPPAGPDARGRHVC